MDVPRAERRRRERFRAAGRSSGTTPTHRSDAERLMYGPAFVLNNRLVIFLAFEAAADPAAGAKRRFLRHEALAELRRVAEMRMLPYGRPMRARTLYRLLCVKDLLGSADWSVAGRIALFRHHGPRNGRTGREITRLIKRFHRRASVLLARGILPTALLDELIGLVPPDRLGSLPDTTTDQNSDRQ